MTESFSDSIEIKKHIEGVINRNTDALVKTTSCTIIEEMGGLKYLEESDAGKDGSLTFVWDDNLLNYTYLNVSPKKNVHLYYANQDEKWEGVDLFGSSIMEERLKKALSFTKGDTAGK